MGGENNLKVLLTFPSAGKKRLIRLLQKLTIATYILHTYAIHLFVMRCVKVEMPKQIYEYKLFFRVYYY